jgi:hypothetical protein
MFEQLYQQAHRQGNQWLDLPWPSDLNADDLAGALGAAPISPELAEGLGPDASRTFAALSLLAGIELTIRFERMIVGHLATVLKDWTVPDDGAMQACLAQFIAEESLHAGTFSRYLQAVAPERYAHGPVSLTAALPAESPWLDGPAGLIAILVLEDLFLHGQDPHLKTSGTWLAELTRRHVLDESRHVRINRALVTTVFGRMGTLQRHWHLRLASRAIRHASRERQILLQTIVHEVITAHPHTAHLQAGMMAELASLQRPIHPVGGKLIDLLAGVLAPFSSRASRQVTRTVQQHLGPLTAFVA